MKKRVVSILMVLCVMVNLLAATSVCVFAVGDANNDAKNAYHQVLDMHADEWGSAYINYTVFDINQDGICELIVDMGGSDGSQCFGFQSGKMIDYGYFSSNVHKFYEKDGVMYILSCILADVSEQGNTYEVILMKPYLNNNEIGHEILYDNMSANGKHFEEVPIPDELEHMIQGALIVEFRNIGDRSLLVPDVEIKEPEEEYDKTDFDSIVSPWAKEEVEMAYQKGLVPKVLEGEDLRKPVSRAEFTAIAVALYENLSDKKADKASNPFVDITGNKCMDEILMAYQLEITVGTSENTFSPDLNISREQMATMLTRTYKKSEFDDWCMENDAEYPLNFMGVKLFADDEEISDYAKESVYFMTRWNIIKGVGDNKFAPKGNVALGEAYGIASREQAIILAFRAEKVLK